MSFGSQYGFKADIPGHTLEENRDQHQHYNILIRCSCGAFGTYMRPRSDGTADSRAQREWNEHLRVSEVDPTQIRGIGVVTKKIVKHEVFVFPMTYVGFDDFAENCRGRYAWYFNQTMTYRGTSPWAVGIHKKTKRTSKKVLHGLYRTEVDAASAARDYLNKCDINGFKVELADAADWSPEQAVELSAQMSFMSLLTKTEEALQSKDIAEIEDALQETEQLLSIVPILTDRRGKLVEYRTHMLTSHLLP